MRSYREKSVKVERGSGGKSDPEKEEREAEKRHRGRDAFVKFSNINGMWTCVILSSNNFPAFDSITSAPLT